MKKAYFYHHAKKDDYRLYYGSVEKLTIDDHDFYFGFFKNEIINRADVCELSTGLSVISYLYKDKRTFEQLRRYLNTNEFRDMFIKAYKHCDQARETLRNYVILNRESGCSLSLYNMVFATDDVYQTIIEMN